MYIIVGILLISIIMVCSFVVGALFSKHLIEDAQEQARYDAMRNEYYRLAGVKTIADPRPYVPPRPRTPRARTLLPHMTQLDRLMHEGKRGTIMWRAGDRKKREEATTTSSQWE